MKSVIFNDSNYLISLFNKNGIEISYLQVNFLMFLFESYYMNKMNVDRLYDEDFYNYYSGPVYPKLYSKLTNKYGESQNIILDDEDSAVSDIPVQRKEILNEIFNKFNSYNEEELMELMKSKFYPGENVDDYAIIPKAYMKKWYELYFLNR